MASAANDSAAQARVVLAIPPADIEVRERIGLFWPAKAEAIGALMARDGQNDPIKVRKNGPNSKMKWRLVAGLHRLEGAKMAALNAIDAIQVSGTDDDLRAIEASENIHRRSFAPIERACFVRAIADAAERQMLHHHDGLTQQQIAIRKRWEAVKAGRNAAALSPEESAIAEANHTTANFAGVYGWSDTVAAAMGMSARSIFLDLALHRAIVAPFPDLYSDLARHPVVGENASALRELVAVKSEPVRGRLIRELLKYPALTVAGAKAQIGMGEPMPLPQTGASKFMHNAEANIRRLSLEQQRSWAPTLAEEIKPQALRSFADAIAAKIEELGV